MKKQVKKTILKTKVQASKKIALQQVKFPYPQNKWIYLIIFAFSFIVYGNSIKNKFALDDYMIIVSNEFVEKGISGIGEIFSYDTFAGDPNFAHMRDKNFKATEGGRYRPLSVVTFAIENQFFGKDTTIAKMDRMTGQPKEAKVLAYNPYVGHFVNVLIFAITCVLIYIVMYMLFSNIKVDNLLSPKYNFLLSLPFVITMLYVAHPIHTEAVSNIKGRDELMAFLFSLLALFYTLKYFETNNWKQMGYAMLYFFLGALSKENTYTFIVIIPLTIYFFTKIPLKRNLQATIPLIIIGLIFLLIRQKIVGIEVKDIAKAVSTDDWLPFYYADTSFGGLVWTFWRYIKLLILPNDLTYDYYGGSLPIVTNFSFMSIFSTALNVGLLILAYIYFKRKSIIGYGLLFYFITFFIVSNIIIPVGSPLNERFMYMSSLGFCIILAYLLLKKLPILIKNKTIFTFVVSAFLLIIFTLYSIKTISRNPAWESNYSLFTTDSAKGAFSKNGHIGLTYTSAEYMRKANEAKDKKVKRKYLEMSKDCCERALNVHPVYIKTLQNLAYTCQNLGEFDKNEYKNALKYLLRCIDCNSADGSFIKSVLQITPYIYAQNIDKQIETYKEVVKIYQDPAYVVFAEMCKEQQENWRNYSKKVGENARKTNAQPSAIPELSLVYNQLGFIYANNKKDINTAIKYLEEGKNIDSNNAELLRNLGIIYGITKDMKSSEEALLMSYAINPNDPTTVANLIATYQNLGNAQKVAEFQAKYSQIHKK